MRIYDNWQKISKKLELAVSKRDDRLKFYSKEETKAYIVSSCIELDYLIYSDENHLIFLELFGKKDLLFSADIETTGLDPLLDKIVSIAFTYTNDKEKLESYFIMWSDVLNNLWGYIQKFLHNNTFIFHNAKFDLKFIEMAGIDAWKIDFRDSQISAYLAKPGRKVGLKHLSGEILDFYYDSFDVMRKGRNILDISVEELARYNVCDTVATYRLEQHFSLFRTTKDEDLYHLELKVCKLLAMMELEGITIDRPYLIELEKTNEIKLMEMEEKAKEICGIENLKSVKQLRKALYDDLAIPTYKVDFTKSGELSTSETALEQCLDSAINETQKNFVTLLIEHKKLSKIQGTFVKGINEKVTGSNKIHTNFNQCVTTTGRLSSSTPNLQNIPPYCRRSFIAAPGTKLVAIDYSQCELRILAHFSGEPTLINAFEKGLDPHLEVAKKLLKKEDITKEERRVCKTLNFGILYGMEAHKLADMTGYSIGEATKFLTEYRSTFPYITEFMRSVYIDVIEQGYTKTLLGRKRFFEFYDKMLINELRSKLAKCSGFEDKCKVMSYYNGSFSEYEAKLLREAGNAPIQGSNADITKLAMIATDKAIIKHSFNATLLLQIHDELVWQVNKKEVSDFIEVMEEAMINVIKLDVPLTVDSHYADNWSDTK